MNLTKEKRRQVEEILKDLDRKPIAQTQAEAISGRLSYADSYRQDHLDRVWLWRRLFRQREIYSRHASNLPTPLIYNAVETLAAQIYMAVFDELPFITTQNANNIEHGESVQRFYRRQVAQAGYEREGIRAIREMLITGTGCLKYGLEQVEIEKQKIWQCFFQSERVENYWMDPQDRDTSNPSFFIQLLMQRKSEVQDLVERGVYQGDGFDQLERALERGKDDSRFDVFRYVFGQERPFSLPDALDLPNPFDEQDPFDPLIPIVEYWGHLPSDDGESIERNRIASMAFGVLRLRNQEAPHSWKPFSVLKFLDSEGSSYGVSLAEVMEPSAIASAEVRNQILDIISQRQEPMWVAGERLDLIQNRYTYTPGRVIQLGGPVQEFQRLDAPDVPQAGLLMLGSLERDAEMTGAISDTLMGISSPPRKTGTEVSQNAANIGVRFRVMAKMIGTDISLMHQRLLLSWSKVFSRKDVQVMLTQMQGRDASLTLTETQVKGAMAGLSQILAVGVDPERADIPATRGKISGLLQLLREFPEARFNLNLRRAIRKMLEALGFHHDDHLVAVPEDFDPSTMRSIDPQTEFLQLMENGIPLQVRPGDDNAYHRNAHMVQARLFPSFKEALAAHISAHFQADIDKIKTNNRAVMQSVQQQIGPVSADLGGGS